jgi:Ala-tRNA(Pro) deacylase
MNENLLFEFLKKHKINYHLYEHQPVFTVEDKPIVTAIDGVSATSDVPQSHFKTLFLRDKNGISFLVSVTEEKRLDLNALSVTLGCARLSFGKPEQLMEFLKLTPGSVTPFGLLFDQEEKVHFVLDEDAMRGSSVSFHPLRNDMTLVMSPQDFLVCMEKMGHSPQIMRIPVK